MRQQHSLTYQQWQGRAVGTRAHPLWEVVVLTCESMVLLPRGREEYTHEH